MTPLRLDDLGASSKRFERHRGKWFPYRELEPEELAHLGEWLHAKHFSMTLAITATWVDKAGGLLAYDQKFPEQAATIQYWVRRGVFEVACHGLTHCIPGMHVAPWVPWHGNRPWHREFTESLPLTTQYEHLRRAKRILEARFGPVTTLVPPGNAISERVADYASSLGFSVITCRARGRNYLVDDTHHAVLHDREIVTQGLRAVLDALPQGKDYQGVAKCVLATPKGTRWNTI